MSYYRRGYSWEQIRYLSAPVGGWNPDAPSWEMAENQAPVLDNFLIRPGKIVARGAFSVQNDLSANVPLNVCGVIPLSGAAVLGRRAANFPHADDPWQAPLLRSTAGTLAAGTTAPIEVAAAFSSVLTWTLDQCPGPRWINFDGLMYGISYDASTAPTTSSDTNGNYTTKNTNLLTVGSSLPPTVATGAPRGGFDLKAHLARIWMLAGVDTPGAGTTHDCNALFFTNPIASGGGMVAADWQDPVTGLTNQMVMDKNISDPGVGLAVTRNNLLVFRYHSVWIVRGTTTANFVIQLVSSEAGCLDARSIVETDHGVYFMSHKGLMLTDGVTVRNVSGSVTHTLQTAVAQLVGQTGARGFGTSYITSVLTAKGQILITLGYSEPVAGNQFPLWCGLYDPLVNAWTRITSSIFRADTANAANNTRGYPGILVTCPGIQGGLLAVGDKYVTKLESNGGINLPMRGLSFPDGPMQGAGARGYDLAADGVSFLSIPLQWTTRLLPIIGASTGSRRLGQAKRWFFDYVFAPDAHFQRAIGWQPYPVDLTGNTFPGVVLNSVPIQTLGQNSSVAGVSTAIAVARYNQDFTNEIGDFAFSIGWSDATRTQATVPLEAIMEIYGIGVEFQPTQDAR